jgi:hypothetical protein
MAHVIESVVQDVVENESISVENESISVTHCGGTEERLYVQRKMRWHQ